MEVFCKHCQVSFNTKRKALFCSRHCVGVWVGKQKTNPWNKGIETSEETKEKIRKKLQGRKMPHVANSNKTRQLSQKTIEMRSKVAKQLWLNQDFREKMSQPLSNETKLKISAALQGEKHYLYKKDRNSLVKSEKKHLDSCYKDWVKGVKNRDNWRCRIANDDCSGRLEAHHILRWSSHPELRYNLNNGITLCRFHHPLKKCDEKNLAPFFTKLVLDIKGK